MSDGLQRVAAGDDSDSDYENENRRPRGLTGLQNLGNTCYLNSALQSLSNCPQLTNYFLDCSQLIQPDKSPMLSKSYLKLITELWHHKRPSYVVPSGVVTGIKAVHPMFRGYTQQDAQEFLRCLMDQLHEELKSPYSDDSGSEDDEEDDKGGGIAGGGRGNRARGTSNSDGSNNALKGGEDRETCQISTVEALERRRSLDSLSSQSEVDYETCDSGLSSERSSNGGGRESNGGLSDGNNSDTNEGTSTLAKQTGSTQSHAGMHRGSKDLTRSCSSGSIKAGQQHQQVSGGSGSYLVRSSSSDSVVVKRGRDLLAVCIVNKANFVANTKEMKETANLLEKESDELNESTNARVKEAAGVRLRGKSGGGAEELGSGEGSRLSAGEAETQSDGAEGVVTSTTASTGAGNLSGDGVQQRQQQCMRQLLHQPKQSAVPGRPVPATMIAQQQQHQQQQQPIPQQQKHQAMQGQAASPRKPKNVRYESIISQTFDGKILSSVRCLNCETVSTIKETFQDLSLPIPSKDHLHMLHSGMAAAPGGVTPPKGGTCGEVRQGWLAWIYSWMKGWFVGPHITLQDCLSAFFSADELKGDNMYSCEKCKKLRNGLKYSRVFELPEILSIHLKRFRHEFYSSKINTFISFPMEGLDMAPYLHKTCKNEATYYDLVAIICHHGTAGGGHYTAYCLNHLNQQWYEFDDQYVTEVDVSQVLSCEAYVLFYRKSNKAMDSIRQKYTEIERNESSMLKFFISKQWMSRFSTFAEPGPITNNDFLCKHGGVPPGKVKPIDDLVAEINQEAWDLLYSNFGGGPVCNHLHACQTCHSELEKIRLRQRTEKDEFILLNEEFQDEDHAEVVYAISMAWFREWEAFVKGKTNDPPGPIENSRIIVHRNGQPVLRQTSDHGHLSADMWHFLHNIYGGGPELMVRQSTGASVKPAAPAPSPVPLHQVAAAAAATTQAATSTNNNSSGCAGAAVAPVAAADDNDDGVSSGGSESNSTENHQQGTEHVLNAL